MVKASSVGIKHYAQYTDEERKEGVNRILVDHLKSGMTNSEHFHFKTLCLSGKLAQLVADYFNVDLEMV